MKTLIYEIEAYTSVYNHETEEYEEVLSPVGAVVYNPTDEDIERAQATAYNGEYTVEGEFDYPIAPRNILAGEYVTIGGVLYYAIENIPNGEKVIVGQNAFETTIEAQLLELKGE